MRELLLDLLLPRTDRGVALQWAVMGPVWLMAVAWGWHLQRDLRHFVWGLCMINLAWFAFRTIH